MNIEGRNLLDNPVRIFQRKSISAQDLLEQLKNPGASTPFLAIVCDKAPIPAKDELIEDLAKSCPCVIYDYVQPNPRTTDIDAMQSDKAFPSVNAVIGIGGGSVMDTAKALAMLSANGGRIEDYLGNDPKLKITNKSLPLILVPTTAGTGSEMTKVGVYTSPSGRKYSLGSPLMHARIAFLTASFLYSAPPRLVAATGADALDHALESIWNIHATPQTLALAEEAAASVLTYLPKAYKSSLPGNPKDEQACEDMLCSSSLAGAAFSMTGTAAGHALSFILSEDWHVPHGAACAFTLLDIFDYSKSTPQTKSSLARIEARFTPGEKDEDILVESLRKRIAGLLTSMQIPMRFPELGVEIKPQDIESHFSRSFEDPKMHNQMPPADPESIYRILKSKC